MRKFLVTISTVLVIAILSVSLIGCAGGYDKTMKEGNLDKNTALQVRSDGSFKILQFTDTHLISNGTTRRDNETLRWMAEAVEEVRPDLVELTGDITGNGTNARNSGILAIANMFEEMKQYWAYSFGNHDGEWSKNGTNKDVWVGRDGKQTKVRDVCVNPRAELDDKKYSDKGYVYFGDNTRGNKEIFDLLGGYQYCLSRQDAKELDPKTSAAMGVGNYVIELKNRDKVVFALIHMDTHGKMYVQTPSGEKKDAGYVGLTNEQIKWYGEHAKKYQELGVKSAVFMHIPHFGFRQATEDQKGISEYGVPWFSEKPNLRTFITNSLFEKTTFIKEEGIYGPRWNDNLEKAIDYFGTTNLIAVGHDHNNSFSIKRNIGAEYVDEAEKATGKCKENNILISYGRCSGVNAWGRRINIGATVYDINTNGNTIEDMYDVEVIYPSFDYINDFAPSEVKVDHPHLN